MIASEQGEMNGIEILNYSPWPKLSTEEYNRIKYRTLQIKRECLNDEFLFKKLGRTVRFEIAKLEDKPLIHEFLLQEFGQQEPLNRALGIIDEDLLEPLDHLLSETLPQKMSILVIDQGDLCGVIINSISKINRMLVKEPKIQNDYGKEIDVNSRVSPNLRPIYTILDEMEAITPNFLPINCQEYLSIDIISVRPEYAGCGLGKRLIIEAFKLAKLNGIRFCEATCTAISSTKICQSLGMKSKFEFPYSDYKYHEQSVFNTELHDGCKAASLMIGDLNEINL